MSISNVVRDVDVLWLALLSLKKVTSSLERKIVSSTFFHNQDRYLILHLASQDIHVLLQLCTQNQHYCIPLHTPLLLYLAVQKLHLHLWFAY